MSSLDSLKDMIPEFAKDIRINLGNVLSTEGAPGLSERQIAMTALACANAVKSPALKRTLGELYLPMLGPEEQRAVKGAAALMAMNNVYYRTTHLMADKEVSSLPARLRMTLIGNPGVPKVDFELMCFAVSTLAGCGACINSHTAELKKNGLNPEAIQSGLRIAATINAAALALEVD